MKLTPLTSFLSRRLNEQMPGKSAHDLMKPVLQNGSPIRISHDKPAREGGVLILFYEEDGRVKFPLIQRPEYEGIHSGQIAFPGGKKEGTDRDLVETALRETEEEIGVPSGKISVVGVLSKFFVAASNFDILPVVGVLHEKPVFVPEEREVSAIITPYATDLLDEEKTLMKDMEVRNGFKLRSPYFNLEEKVVWGATAMMLSELKVILRDHRFS